MKFIIYTPALNDQVGGIIVLHQLAKDLNDLGYPASLFYMNGMEEENPFCSYFAKMEDVDDETVVIYPEIIEGNPLNAKKVVRWILCDIGVHCPSDIYKSWNQHDLVFHFSSFNDQYKLEDIEILYALWIHPKIVNQQRKRSGSCYLFRKASSFHRHIDLIHPQDALMIDGLEIEEIIRIFNEKEYFYNYDPHSYYDAIAALCGCIPIVYPLAGISKFEWLKSKASFQGFIGSRHDMAGIAYGKAEIPYARDTLHLAPQEQRDAVEYGKKTVERFCTLSSDYFFQRKTKYPFKTVGSIVSSLHLDQRLPTLKCESFLEKRVKSLELELAQSHHLIEKMKTSKFWKIHDWYHGIKDSFRVR